MRRLPDGSVCRVSEEDYCNAWDELARPLVEKLGWKVCAYDPGYMFEAPGGYTIELAANEVRAIGALIQRLAKLERAAEVLDGVASPLAIDGANHAAAVKHARAALAAVDSLKDTDHG